MKFTVNSKTLTGAVTKALQAVHNNPVVPVLSNLLFEATGNLTITGSDLSTTITTCLTVDIEQSGSACIPAKLLVDTLKALPEQPITIEAIGNSATIQSHTGTFKMAIEDSSDFVDLNRATGQSFEIDTHQLVRSLDKTVFCASNDDLRPSMTGVLFEVRPDYINLASTDGHRLSVDTFTANAFEADVVVAAKGLSQIKSILTEATTTVTIGSNYITFNSGVEVTLRLIDELFPAYRNVLPENNNIKMGLNKNTLLSSLKRVGLFSNSQTGAVSLQFSNNELRLKADDGTVGNKAVETVEVEGEADLLIGFNHKYLTEVISRVETDNFVMTFSESMRAAIIENGDNLLLIMPVMISEEVLA